MIILQNRNRVKKVSDRFDNMQIAIDNIQGTEAYTFLVSKIQDGLQM